MKRTVAMLRSKETRKSLWYNLIRIWVEHQYCPELKRLHGLADIGAHLEAQVLIEELRQSNGYYLEPALIRAETFLSFMED